MAQRKLLSVHSSEPGPQISRTAIFVPTSLARVRPIRRLSMGNLQTPLHESCPPFQWGGWEILTKLQKLRFFWRRMIPALLQVSNSSLMAVEGKSDRETLHRRPCHVTFRRDA